MFKSRDFTFTNITIGLTVIMYLVQTNIQYGGLYLGLNMYFTQGGVYWQPLSSMCAHGGLGHLGMNMFVLYQFGSFSKMFSTYWSVLIIPTNLNF